MKPKTYRVEPFPRMRRFAMDAGRLGRGKHIVHGLIEVDVTEPRQVMRTHEAETGETLSLTAFVITCLGRAIDRFPHLHAYRNWRNQLVIYDDVQVVTMIEIEKHGQKVPMPHLLQGVNTRSVRQIHDEIRAAQSQPAAAAGSRFMGWFLYLPWFVRRIFYWAVMRIPQLLRDYTSPVLVTSVGMFGRGGGWGIPMPNATVQITIGGITQKPGVVQGRIEIREYLHLTVSLDHDIVDGAPAARFVGYFTELLEGTLGLEGEAES